MSASVLAAFWREVGDGELMTERELIEFVFADVRFPLMFSQKQFEESLRDGVANDNLFGNLEKLLLTCD